MHMRMQLMAVVAMVAMTTMLMMLFHVMWPELSRHR